MKHDHSVEVKLSPDLQETVDETKETLQSLTASPKTMLFIGIAIGALGMRLLQRPPMQQLIVVSGDAAVIE